jgi:hypothetical protein
MMNQEIKAAWVSALRSGEYEQGEAALQVGNKFCCLGVLCDIAVKQFDLKLEVEKDMSGCSDDTCCDPDRPRPVAYNGESAFLPSIVADWAGLEDKGGTLTTPVRTPVGDDAHALYVANDGGLTFPQIADIIEAQF